MIAGQVIMFALRRIGVRWMSKTTSRFFRRGVGPIALPLTFDYGKSPCTDSLCFQCAEIDFTLFTKSSERGEHDLRPPTLSWNTFYPQQCSICQLLVHCVSHSRGIHKPFQGTLRGIYAGHELQLYTTSGGTDRKLDYSIQHCQITPSSYRNEDPQKAADFDVNELKVWLEACEIHQCLPSDLSQHPLPKGFRVIDVENQCIVQPQKLVRYCALSYVWGGIEQPLLTSHNRLESPDSLKDLSLPRTILDAMALCQDIGCRYLWVDSLCIVQDSKNDKHHQINSMADVYSLSFLAIIACGGDDANAGLAPYGNPHRHSNVSWLIRSNSNGSFVASLSPQIAAQEIEKSVWASRGWTLQEYALSRRVLFFTGSYTFLRCEKGLWCEDFGLGFSNCFEVDRKWDLPLPPFYRRKPDPDRHYSSTFSQLLAQFVHRSLRYEEDILNAFTGILTRMEEKIGPHILGLPSKEIGAALQWTTNQPFPSLERKGFPSWSWAGWIHTHDVPSRQGSFRDMYEGFDRRSSDISVLSCYAVMDNKSIYTVEECTIDQILSRLNEFKYIHKSSKDTTEITPLEMDLRQNFTPKPCKELIRYIALQHASKPPLSNHLFLWASCVSLYVDRQPKPTESLDTDFRIRVKKNGPQISSIRLKSKWRETQPDFMDFFVSTVGVYLTSGPDPDIGQVKLKVILVKLHSNTTLPVYKRIQVVNEAICFDDWKLANPQSRFIALV